MNDISSQLFIPSLCSAPAAGRRDKTRVFIMFFFLKLRGEKCGANEEMFVLLKVLRTVDSLSPPPHPPTPTVLVFLFEVQDEVRD